jgi:site-specific DNA-methyltransferase (adenine-specific)
MDMSDITPELNKIVGGAAIREDAGADARSGAYTSPYYDHDGVTIYHGDCREVLPEMSAESVGAVVTDPPYELGMGGWDRSGVAFDTDTWRAVLRVMKPGSHLFAFGGTRTYHHLGGAIEDAGFEIRDCVAWLHGQGFPKGQNLKPGFEPILLARKSGLHVLNIDPGRLNSGRWPANVVLDESAATALDDQSGEVGNGWKRNYGEDYAAEERQYGGGVFGGGGYKGASTYVDSGGASRFFYCAKASKSDRGRDNDHPTVKPVELMRWLIRLVGRPVGGILDPFVGSGTTLQAAFLEHHAAIGIEMDAHYCDLSVRRLSAVQPGMI